MILDRAYEDPVHDALVPALEWGFLHDEEGLVYELGTLSKVPAPALRIGYLIRRDGPSLRALVQRTSDAVFSAPLITREITGYLLDTHMDDQLKRVNAGYREKAPYVKGAIDALLGDQVAECRGG